MRRTESHSSVDKKPPVVISVTPETPVLDETHSVNVASVCRERSIGGLTYFVDFLGISLVTQSLIGEWLHELFEQLKKYDSAPSKEIQQTWLGFPIIGAATASTLIALAMNHHYAKKNPGKHLAAEDYLSKLFSSSFLYFAIDTLSETGIIPAMSMPVFVTISTFGLPLVAASFLKLASPPSNQYTNPLSASFKPFRNENASDNVRRLNASKSVKNSFFSSNTLLWVVNRELYGETVSLSKLQIAALLFFLIGAGKVGYEKTTHPKFFQGFSAFLVLCEVGALIYAAISGIFLMVVVYNCSDRKFCISESTKEFLSYVCAAIALPLALYMAAFMRIRFEEEHEINEKLIAWFGVKKTAVIDGCGTSFEKMKKTISGCSQEVSTGFHSFTEKISSYCSRTNAPTDESSPLADGLNAFVHKV